MPDPSIAKETANILEAMTRSVLNSKPKRGTTLTPVGAERPPSAAVESATARIPDLPSVFMPQEQIEAVEREIRFNALKLLKIADAIRESLGLEPIAASGIVIDPQAAQKAAEKAADEAAAARKQAEQPVDTVPEVTDNTEAFAAQFAAQQAAAQAATFTGKAAGDDTEDEDPPGPVAGWVCPTHGGFIDAESPRGRKFRRCAKHPACNQFER